MTTRDELTLQRLAAWGVSTIDPASRNSGWLDWLERGTVSWDDAIAYDDVTMLEFYLELSRRSF